MNILSSVIYIFKLFTPYIFQNYINDVDLVEKGLYFDIFAYNNNNNNNNKNNSINEMESIYIKL